MHEEAKCRDRDGLMSANSIGSIFRVMSFGESHGRCVGVVIDGCPAGLKLDMVLIQKDLDRRRTGQNPELSSVRKEEDKVEILSGVFNGVTTGAPVCMLVWNKDTISEAYEQRRYTPRPGHADFTGFVKYGGFEDYRGGGRFSARNTAGFVIAGTIAKQLLERLNIEVLAHTTSIGKVSAGKASIEDIRANVPKNGVGCADPDAADKMAEAISKAKKGGDSLGGTIEGIAINLPVGLGEPIFENLDGELSKALFAIPAVKAVEFGSGFKGSTAFGSENNDEFMLNGGKVVTRTNNSGGILGGISDGMPIVVKIGFKPIASIPKKQTTVNLKDMKEVEISSMGRFDPCPIPRAIPIVEGMMAIVLCDFALRSHLIPPVLK